MHTMKYYTAIKNIEYVKRSLKNKINSMILFLEVYICVRTDIYAW